MSEERRVFEAEIIAGRGGGAMVEIPFSVKDVYGTGGQVAEWVGGAKKQETRDRRAAKSIEMLLAGETR